jgi:myo-inositol 2-dehydrogenase/D-chiro-inositol 1-dehydrogenase
MMGFNYRLNKLYQSVRSHIASGALGQLLTVRTVFATNGKHLPAWKLKRQTGGGVLLDLASHHLDLIRYFFNQEVAELMAVIESRRSEHDTAWLQMRLADGLTIQSFFSTAGVEEDSFEIYGAEQKLSVDRHRSLAVRVSNSRLKGLRIDQLKQPLRNLINAPYAISKIRAVAQEPSYRAALSSFVNAVSTNANRAPDFSDGYRNLLIIDAAERSARTGSRVSLDLRRVGAMCA